MRSPPDREIYVHRSTDPWVKAGIAGGLVYLWRGPLIIILTIALLAVGISMLIVPSWTALGLAAIVGLFGVHRVRRPIRR
jgi:uncharacterized membrane protein YiaA